MSDYTRRRQELDVLLNSENEEECLVLAAAEWLDRQARFHEQNAYDEPDDEPVMTESDCSRAIAGYLRKAAHNLRTRACNRDKP